MRKIDMGILNFFRPVLFIFQGLWLIISNLSLLKSSLPPMLLTGVLFINFIYIGLAYLNTAFYQLIYPYLKDPLVGESLNLLQSITGPNMMLAAFMGIFLLVSTLICLPFLEKISRDTEILLAGYEKNVFIQRLSFGTIFIDMLLLACLILFIGLLSIGLVFIPLIGQLLIMLLNCLLIAFECLDMTLTRKNYLVKEKIEFIRDNFVSFLIFASPILVIYYLPVLQVLILPAATVGGVLYLREND